MSLLKSLIPESCREAFARDTWSGVFAGMYTAMLGPYLLYSARKDLHSSEFLLGLIVAAPFIGCILSIFYVHAMEGRRKMPFMIWPQAIGRALFALVLFINTPLPFALVACAAQLATSLGAPPYAAIMKEIYPLEQRGRMMAYVRVVCVTVVLVFTPLAGKVLQSAGYRVLFPLGAVVGIAAALIFNTIKTAPVDPSDPANQRVPILEFVRDTFAILKRDRGNRRFAKGAFVAGIGGLILPPIITVMQVNKLHITEYQLAVIATLSTAAWMLSYPFWGKLVDSRNPLISYAVGMLMSAALPLSYFFAHTWWQVIPGAVFASASIGGTELGYFNAILHYSEEGRETQYQGLHLFAQGVRGTVGPFIGAWLLVACEGANIPKQYALIIPVALILLGCVMLLTWMRKEHVEQADADKAYDLASTTPET